MKQLIIKLIKLYQVCPFHSHSMCRFYPTCSNYMIEALNEYGLCKGLFLGLKRLLRCHPFGAYGYDPLVKKGDIK